jgi:predicted dehydrogenase
LIEAAALSGATLMAGHTFEYNAAVWKVRELIEMGELGELHYIDGARLNLGLYQSDVNVVWDLAPHDVSIFNHLLQSVPTSVQAWGERHVHPSLEDVAHLHLEYGELNITASVHVSWLDPCKVRRTTVVGDRRMLVYNDGNENERVRLFDKGVEQRGDDLVDGARMSYRFGDIVVPYIEFHEPLGYQDQHFVNCVINGSRPATDGETGRAVVAVLEAAQLSLSERRPVAIDEVASLRAAVLEGVAS